MTSYVNFNKFSNNKEEVSTIKPEDFKGLYRFNEKLGLSGNRYTKKTQNTQIRDLKTLNS